MRGDVNGRLHRPPTAPRLLHRLGHLRRCVRHHRASSRRHDRQDVRPDHADPRRSGRDRDARSAPAPAGAGRAQVRPVRQVDVGAAPGRPRPDHGAVRRAWQPEGGQGSHRRQAIHHHCPNRVHGACDVDLRHTRGDILGGASALCRRLPVHLRGIQRPRCARLPAGPGYDVHRLRLLRPERGRPLLRRLRRDVLAGRRGQLGQGVRHDQPSLGARHRARDVGHGGADPCHAQQPARRAQQALRHHGEGQGRRVVAPHPKVSREGGHKPDGQHSGLPAAVPRRRERDSFGGA